MQIVSVTGIYGVSFAVVAVNAAFTEVLHAWQLGKGLRAAGLALSLSVLPAIVLLLFGFWTLDTESELENA